MLMQKFIFLPIIIIYEDTPNGERVFVLSSYIHSIFTFISFGRRQFYNLYNIKIKDFIFHMGWKEGPYWLRRGLIGIAILALAIIFFYSIVGIQWYIS